MRPRRLLPRVWGEPGARAQGRRAGWGPPVPVVTLAPWNQVKPAGELCRPAKDQCDLGEHCDGRWPTCPEDAFRENACPARGATATMGPAQRWPGAARTCGGQVRRAQPQDRQGGEGGSGSQAGGLTHSCLQARGWPWRLASATASPKAVGLGSPCSLAGERPSWPSSPRVRDRDVPLPGATRRSST